VKASWAVNLEVLLKAWQKTDWIRSREGPEVLPSGCCCSQGRSVGLKSSFLRKSQQPAPPSWGERIAPLLPWLSGLGAGCETVLRKGNPITLSKGTPRNTP